MPSPFKNYHARFLCRFLQLPIKCRQWRPAADGEFQIGGIVSRKLVITRERQNIVYIPGDRLQVLNEREASA